MIKKTLVAAVAGTLLAGMTASASALEFYYDAYGGFVDGSDVNFPAPVDFFNENVAYSSGALHAPAELTYQQLSWGGPVTGHSNLSINEEGFEPPAPPWNTIEGGNLDPDAEALGHEWINAAVTVSDDFGSVMGWLTHHNEVISEAFVGTVTVHYHLDYYSGPEKTEDQLVWSSPEMNFQLQIWETPNQEPCNPDQTEGTVCDDRFGYRVLNELGDPVGDFGDTLDLLLGSFNYEGDRYVVSSSGFFDDEGNLLGFAWSGEELENAFYVNHEVHIPEPGTIVLLGLGLAGLGYRRHRAKRAA